MGSLLETLTQEQKNPNPSLKAQRATLILIKQNYIDQAVEDQCRRMVIIKLT